MDPKPIDRPPIDQLGIDAPTTPSVPWSRPESIADRPLLASAPPAGLTARIAGRAKWPLRLAGAFAVLSVLCLGVVGYAFHAYDRATKVDRSAPDVVVDSYLQAFLVQRDDRAAAEFACSDQTDLRALGAFRESMEAREKVIDGQISVSWGGLDESMTAQDTAIVSVTLTESATVGGVAQRLSTRWTFIDRKSGDWRVCEASQSS